MHKRPKPALKRDAAPRQVTSGVQSHASLRHDQTANSVGLPLECGNSLIARKDTASCRGSTDDDDDDETNPEGPEGPGVARPNGRKIGARARMRSQVDVPRP
jgi:hypothetical protein